MSALKVTQADVEAVIASAHYFTASDGATAWHVLHGANDIPGPADKSLSLLTFCVLVLKNGATVHGACTDLDPAKMDAAHSRLVARENAIANLRPLVAYAERERPAGYDGEVPE